MRRSGRSKSVHDFQVGDTVALTGKFLRSTGQYTGSDAHGKWKVIAVERGYVFVNEPSDTSWYSAEELAADPLLGWRRFSPANLYRVGTLSSRNA